MIKNSNLAPILIPTLNRYGHIKRCLDSLAQNTHAQESLLYIALDAPTKKEHEDGYNKIIEHLDQVSSFKEVIIIKRDRNLGPIKNTLTSLDELFKKYDQIILSEDDNFFKLVKTANYLLPKLFDMVEKDRIAGDAIFIMNMIKKKMFCVFPTVSKVRNYGNDGTGANCHRDEENI